MLHAPVKLIPAYKDYLWGGTKLADRYGKQSSTADILAESWELSTHKDGQSVIADGPFAGYTLRDYLSELGSNVLGHKAEAQDGELPILVKFMDARESLSIQVHPDNAYAQEHEGDSGKTEMWLILESEPGAFLYFGVKQAVTREALEQMIQRGDIDSALQRVPAKKGDIFFIPAGTIHAIGAGLVICEIQQSSNATYRLYDFDRVDSSGAKRELHLKRALDVAILIPQAINTAPELILCDSAQMHISLLRSCQYFSTYRYQLSDTSVTIHGSEESFLALVCLHGTAELYSDAGALDVSCGDSIFIPAQNAAYTLRGSCEFLIITL